MISKVKTEKQGFKRKKYREKRYINTHIKY